MAENNCGGKQIAASKSEAKDWSTKAFYFLEVMVMTPIIMATVGVFLIPIVLYALPPPPPPPPPPSNASEVSSQKRSSFLS